MIDRILSTVIPTSSRHSLCSASSRVASVGSTVPPGIPQRPGKTSSSSARLIRRNLSSWRITVLTFTLNRIAFLLLILTNIIHEIRKKARCLCVKNYTNDQGEELVVEQRYLCDPDARTIASMTGILSAEDFKYLPRHQVYMQTHKASHTHCSRM